MKKRIVILSIVFLLLATVLALVLFGTYPKELFGSNLKQSSDRYNLPTDSTITFGEEIGILNEKYSIVTFNVMQLIETQIPPSFFGLKPDSATLRFVHKKGKEYKFINVEIDIPFKSSDGNFIYPEDLSNVLDLGKVYNVSFIFRDKELDSYEENTQSFCNKLSKILKMDNCRRRMDHFVHSSFTKSELKEIFNQNNYLFTGGWVLDFSKIETST